jgi:hypothetical protein
VEELLTDPSDRTCECCASDGVLLAAYRMDNPKVKEDYRLRNIPPFKVLCSLCAGTMTGMWDEYFEYNDENAIQIMKTICYVGNEILKAIQNQKG